MKQTTPNTMRAAAIDHFGGIETIKLQTLPVPEVGPDEGSEVRTSSRPAREAAGIPSSAKAGSPRRFPEPERSSPMSSAPTARARSRGSVNR